MVRMSWLSRCRSSCLCILIGSLLFSPTLARAQVTASCASTCGHSTHRTGVQTPPNAVALYNSLINQSNQNAQAVANAVANIVSTFLSSHDAPSTPHRGSEEYGDEEVEVHYDAAAAERRRRAEESREKAEEARAEQEARWASEEAERAAAATRAAEETERQHWATRQRLWAEQHGGAVDAAAASPSVPADDPNDPAAQRLALWRAQHSGGAASGDRTASSSSQKSEGDERLALWRAQHDASKSSGADAVSPVDAALDHALQAIQAIEEREHIGTEDPISSTLDGLWNDIGEGASPPTRAVLEQAAGAVNDELLGMLRDGVGQYGCGNDAGGSGSAAVDQAYAGFWSGVCGGWLGRPISPSGIYGYVNENVIGGFTKLFDATTAELGLMPAGNP